MVIQRYVGNPDTGSISTTPGTMFSTALPRSGIFVYNSHASQNWYCYVSERGEAIPTMTSAGINAMWKVAPGESKFIPATQSQVITEVGSGATTTRTARQVLLHRSPEGTSL